MGFPRVPRTLYKMLEIITNESFLGAFLLMTVMIAAGYILRRRDIINSDGKGVITAVIWKLALPCMAFSAFMHDFSYESIAAGIAVMVSSAVLYILWMIIGRLLFRRCGKRKSVVASFMISLGQLTLFTMPLFRSLGLEKALLYCGIMTLVFRVMLYFVAFPSIAESDSEEGLGSAAKKVLLNPVMIAMVTGMLIWLCQGFLPKVNGICIFRIDKTLPAIYRVISVLSDMVSPLAMLLVGLSIGACDIKNTLKSRGAWVAAILRTIICPLLALAVVFLFGSFFDRDAALTLVLGLAAPASVTVNVFCSSYDYEEVFASHITVLSTLICILTFPAMYAVSSFLL